MEAVSEIFTKKAKKVCDNNLTHAGDGAMALLKGMSQNSIFIQYIVAIR